MSADWVTISSLATAGGTLVLAVATFASVRSANRSARLAEETLLASVRPLLMPSRLDDPMVKVGFQDEHWVHVPGGTGTIEVTEDAVYLTMSLRNAGSGIAVLHGWRIERDDPAGERGRPPLEEFRRLTRDIYIPSGDVYFWQGAIREPEDVDRAFLVERIGSTERTLVDVLYGDQHGGQRVIARFALTPREAGGYLASIGRQWNVDRPDPR
ncbi:MAG TPA: hypothetical protein VFE86_05340 [Ilumatobacteraceae bacterium]|nr:hypothetical protein [Ilumatobacteraceae bacterium]